MQSIKIIKNGTTVIVILSDGSILQSDNISNEDFANICNPNITEDEIKAIIIPDYNNILKEKQVVNKIITSISNSKLLTMKGEAVYWEEVSMLSMPKELVNAIIEAENNNDSLKIETYKNFWTLMSLNPDEQCRLNLFWFLNKWGLKISRCGFFVAYRNVDIHKESTEENPIYTDNFTHTFKIKIGDMVTLDRKKCDSNSDVSCSKGLICSPLY